MSEQENKEIYRPVLNELYKRGNWDVVDEYFAPDFVFHLSIPGIPTDREAAKQHVRGITSAFSDRRFTIEDLIAEDDKVVARWSDRGVHTGELMGIPPTGKEVSLKEISIVLIENGKIRRCGESLMP